MSSKEKVVDLMVDYFSDELINLREKVYDFAEEEGLDVSLDEVDEILHESFTTII